MWLLLLLFPLLFSANGFGQEKLPNDMLALIERLKACDQLWRQDFKPSKRPISGEAEKLERINAQLRKFKCPTLIKDVLQIRSKYAKDQRIAALCDRVLKDPGKSAADFAKGDPNDDDD